MKNNNQIIWCTGRFNKKCINEEKNILVEIPKNECPYHTFCDIDNIQTLWCRASDQAVFDLQACPRGFWSKNDRGFPITEKGGE